MTKMPELAGVEAGTSNNRKEQADLCLPFTVSLRFPQ